MRSDRRVDVLAECFAEREPLEFGPGQLMPVGSSVVTAREGRVVRVAGNLLTVLHADGSFASYWPLGELSVEVGKEVLRGDPLGVTGTLDRAGVHSDIGSEPQLDFGVFLGKDGGGMKSLAVRFDDGSEAGIAPVTGLAYGGPRHASGN